MADTLCVIGSDAFNLDLLRRATPKGVELLEVLTIDDVQPPSNIIRFESLLDRAEQAIADAGVTPAGFVGHLDFPVTALVSVLSDRYKTNGPPPQAIAHLENKYWFRQAHRAVAPETAPDCVALNPFDPEGALAAAPDYPFWLKPVKAHSSRLGRLVRSEDELAAGLHECRLSIHKYGEPFDAFLNLVGAPEGVDAEIGGNHAVAEALIDTGQLFTIEGLVHKGKTVVVGVIETMRGGPEGTSLTGYVYPGAIPEDVVEEARAQVAALLKHVGFDEGPFNVEFFWNEESGSLNMLEVNPRISKSHSPLFEMVDGASHHRQAIELALGRAPELPAGKGDHATAAKFMLRSTEADGRVKRVPTKDEIDALNKVMPGLMVQVLVEKDQRLSELPDQDSYSYELADLFIGDHDRDTLRDAYARCVDSLPFLIQPLPEAEG